MKYLSIVAFAFFLFVCYGWGYALIRWISNRDKDSFAFLSVIGVACLIFLGGVLNLARLAYPTALGILLLSGLTFCLISFSANAKVRLTMWRPGSLINPEKLKSFTGGLLPISILIIAVGFYALTLLPSAAFNYSDDFQSYIPRPLRMLQTGTMAGNPFDNLGIDIGAFAFLHGFVLLGFPIEYLLGFDAVFSFALTGLLLIAIGKKLNLHWSYTTFSLIGFIVINPQSVNISALYTGSAIILGIIFASCHLLDQMEKSGRGEIPIISAGILGLLLTSAVAVKTSFAIFVFAYFTLFFAGLLLISRDWRKILKISSLVVLGALVALLPWLELNFANYVAMIYAVLHPLPIPATTPRHGEIAQLFSTGNLFYGGSFLSYGIIVLMLFVTGFYALFNIPGKLVAPTQRGYFLVAAVSSMAGIVCYLFNGLVSAPEVAVRYSCPVLIAILPFAWLTTSMTVHNTGHPVKLPNLSGMKMAVMFFMSFLIVFLFWANFIDRIERAYYRHFTLSFPVNDAYIEHYGYVASSDARQEIRKIQLIAQPGQKILAWVGMPGHLDFSRNEIYSVRDQCLVNPWIDMPLNGNVNDMIRYLKKQGIRYILWEYKDPSSLNNYRGWLSNPYNDYRIMGERVVYFRGMLASIMKGKSFLYQANGIVLFDLQQIID